MHGNLFQDDSGNYYIFSEESSEYSEALKRRREECIQEGGVFSELSNQCCDPNTMSANWTPGSYCPDPLEWKKTRRMIYIGAGVGALALGAGLWWWSHRRNTPTPAQA